MGLLCVITHSEESEIIHHHIKVTSHFVCLQPYFEDIRNNDLSTFFITYFFLCFFIYQINYSQVYIVTPSFILPLVPINSNKMLFSGCLEIQFVIFYYLLKEGQYVCFMELSLGWEQYVLRKNINILQAEILTKNKSTK